MSKWQKHFFLATAVIIAAALLAVFSAGPAIAQIRAALVSDINNPARQPVQLIFQETIPAGQYQTSMGTSIYTVPQGKRLVIEYLYVYAVAKPGQGIMATVIQYPTYVYPVEPRFSTMFGDFFYQSSTPVRIYFDPGAEVRVVTGRNDATGNASVALRLNGHLVDLQ